MARAKRGVQVVRYCYNGYFGRKSISRSILPHRPLHALAVVMGFRSHVSRRSRRFSPQDSEGAVSARLPFRAGWSTMSQRRTDRRISSTSRIPSGVIEPESARVSMESRVWVCQSVNRSPAAFASSPVVTCCRVRQ